MFDVDGGGTGDGGSGGAAATTTALAAASGPASTAASTSSTSTSSTDGSSSSSGSGDPALCTQLVWSGSPVWLELEGFSWVSELVQQKDGQVGLAYAWTVGLVRSLTFDGWGEWPPAMGATVDHANYRNGDVALAPSSDGTFAFARLAGGGTVELGRATPGAPGAELAEVAVPGTNSVVLTAPAPSGQTLLVVNDGTQARASLLSTTLTAATYVGPMGCGRSRPLISADVAGDRFVVVSTVHDTSDDCENPPPVDPEADLPSSFRVHLVGTDGNVLVTDDATVDGGIVALSVVGTAPPRVVWQLDRDGGTQMASLDERGIIGEPVTVRDGIVPASAAPWRDGLAVARDHYDASVARQRMGLEVFDASSVAATPPLDAGVVTEHPSRPAVLVAPDGRSFLWFAYVALDSEPTEIVGPALFRAECR